jgi:hypothetical protein
MTCLKQERPTIANLLFLEVTILLGGLLPLFLSVSEVLVSLVRLAWKSFSQATEISYITFLFSAAVLSL